MKKIKSVIKKINDNKMQSYCHLNKKRRFNLTICLKFKSIKRNIKRIKKFHKVCFLSFVNKKRKKNSSNIETNMKSI